jgi:uncharacterized membrane protein YeaQ/YmgE (transglycosylase-associated protein family)
VEEFENVFYFLNPWQDAAAGEIHRQAVRANPPAFVHLRHNRKGTKAMDMNLIIQLIAGIVGGNAAGAIMKDKSLGTIGNSVAGLVGGGLGGQILGMLTGAGAGAAAAGAGGADIAGIIGSIASGGIGGGVLLAIVGMIKGMMAKS